jgi:UDP-glucuronate 4-epimerase
LIDTEQEDFLTKTVLLTGAAGFIGSHVMQDLLSRGDTVVGLDNLNDYYDVERKRANISEAEKASLDGPLRFFEGDIRDVSCVTDLFTRYNFDVVIHLAAMAGVRASIETPNLYFDVNLTGTLNLMQAASAHKTSNFVLASTSSVYGATDVIPFVETDVCNRPLAPYAASKRAAEMLGYTYHHLYGQNVTCLRFFTVYGPRNRPDMMAYKILDNIFTGRKVPLYNNGQMYRDWTYVDDIAAGVVAAADRPLGYETINLGRGEPILLSDFVRMIEELAGRPAHLTSAPMPSTDMSYTLADISKAQRLLGYNPRVCVRDGVKKFYQWYLDNV